MSWLGAGQWDPSQGYEYFKMGYRYADLGGSIGTNQGSSSIPFRPPGYKSVRPAGSDSYAFMAPDGQIFFSLDEAWEYYHRGAEIIVPPTPPPTQLTIVPPTPPPTIENLGLLNALILNPIKDFSVSVQEVNASVEVSPGTWEIPQIDTVAYISDTTQTVADTTKDTTQTVVDTVKDTTQMVADTVKDTTQMVADTVKKSAMIPLILVTGVLVLIAMLLFRRH